MKFESVASAIVATAACACALSAVAAVPVIDTEPVSIKQDKGRSIVIEYKMNPASPGDGELAIVTVDVLTNDVSVGGEHLRDIGPLGELTIRIGGIARRDAVWLERRVSRLLHVAPVLVERAAPNAALDDVQRKSLGLREGRRLTQYAGGERVADHKHLDGALPVGGAIAGRRLLGRKRGGGKTDSCKCYYVFHRLIISP